jgi:hypothetical protein
MSTSIPTADVVSLVALAEQAAADYYGLDIFSLNPVLDQSKLVLIEAKYAGLEWNYQALSPEMCLAHHLVMSFNPDEYGGAVPDADGMSADVFFNAPTGTLDGQRPKDLAAAYAVILWGESQGIATSEVMMEMFEHMFEHMMEADANASEITHTHTAGGAAN